MQAQRHRPFGVTVLAILAGIAFVIDGFVTLVFIGAIPATLIQGTGFFGQALLGALLWGVLTALWAWVAIGLWNLNPQAWLFVVFISLLNLVLCFASVLGGTPWGTVLPIILINGAILIYSLLPGTKESFGQIGPQP